MTETVQTPSVRFKFQTSYSNYQLKDITEVVERPLEMKDDSLYSLVTVKRRNEGIVKRGDFLGKDIKVKNQYTVRSGDFLISKRQIIHGACEIVPEALDGSIVSNEYYVLHGKKGILLNEYLNLLSKTSTLKKYYALACVGVDIEKMLFRIDDWSSRSVLIPTLDEQQKIVFFFALIDQKIEKQQEKIEQLELFKKGMLQKIFSQEIRFRDENGQEFPNWDSSVLEELGSFIRNYSFSRSVEGEGEYHHVHYGDIHSKFSGVITSQTELSSLGIDSDTEYTLLEDGDIVFADASEDTSDLGKSVVLLEANNRKIIGGLHTHCFRPNSRLDALFLHFFTQTTEYRKFINVNANGVSVFGLSKPALSSLEIPLPDINEQRKISSFLYKISQKVELLKKRKSELEVMKKGFMNQMFV